VSLVEELLESVAHLDCPVTRVCVGLHWTVVESRHAGMSHTYKTGRKVELRSAGNLAGRSALELARRLRSWEPLEASLGAAALNSLMGASGETGNAFEHVEEIVAGRSVAVIGRFPGNGRIAARAGQAWFLEMDPREGEYPPQACEELLPRSDVIVLTATALLNRTLPRLLALGAGATTVVLGPSTPMNDVLFRHGADVLGGVRVTDPDRLVESVMQGAKRFERLAGTEAVVRVSGRTP
jgi:uncharacterized protein (DUF4213/DUF364 family)